MTLPRQVFAGRVVMVTRRCVQRQFLLRPDDVVDQVLTYCLGLAAQRFDIEVFCFVALSNHFHMGIRDPSGQLPRFMELFDALVARALNCHRHRGENLWAPGSYSAVTLADDQDVLNKLVYMICNPCAGDLVARPEQWPGLITLPEDLGQRELVARRPTIFFRQPGIDDELDATAAGKAKRHHGPRDLMPDEVRLRLSRPPGFDDLDDDAFRTLVAERVAERVRELTQLRRRRGRRVLGPRAILRQDPTDSPGSSEPTFGLNPRLACRDRWRMLELRQDLAQFWRDHAEASARFRAGERNVLFPAGTWLYRVLFGARCRPSSPAA